MPLLISQCLLIVLLNLLLMMVVCCGDHVRWMMFVDHLSAVGMDSGVWVFVVILYSCWMSRGGIGGLVKVCGQSAGVYHV